MEFVALTRPARRGQGFTMIEVLVVVLVIGMSAGLVGAALWRSDGDSLLAEAERLAQYFDHAGTEARLSGHAVAWNGESAGYRFSRLSEEAGWREIVAPAMLGARLFPAGVFIEGVHGAAGAPRDAMRLEWSADGPRTPAAITLAMGPGRIVVAVPLVGPARVDQDAARPALRSEPR